MISRKNGTPDNFGATEGAKKNMKTKRQGAFGEFGCSRKVGKNMISEHRSGMGKIRNEPNWTYGKFWKNVGDGKTGT